MAYFSSEANIKIVPEVSPLSLLLSTIFLALVTGLYLLFYRKRSAKARAKLKKAENLGLTEEPATLHPKIDPTKCIGSGSCVRACPEKDILGLVSGRGALINASHCIGHGACAEACPVGAITLVFGNERRGVEIPHVTPNFETNIKGVFIVGELGGMGLIKNAVSQGKQAVEYISCQARGWKRKEGVLDLIIIGAGPAGIGASLTARKNGLSFSTIEQNDIGGAVLNYPRHKIVMTKPVELPLYGSVKLKETTKEALLGLWTEVMKKTGLAISTGEKMTGLVEEDGHYRVATSRGEYRAKTVVLAIGRRGTPRKLGVAGENLPKVAYSLLDPDQHKGQDILVVGGGDSAVEAAMALSASGNRVVLSYRGGSFTRVKPANRERLDAAVLRREVDLVLESNVVEISETEALLETRKGRKAVPNQFVYIFAGGELQSEFLKTIGVRVEKKFGTR